MLSGHPFNIPDFEQDICVQHFHDLCYQRLHVQLLRMQLLYKTILLKARGMQKIEEETLSLMQLNFIRMQAVC